MSRSAAPALIAVTAMGLSLAGCRPRGPIYERPPAPMAATWETPAPWRAADPKDAIVKGAWWTSFHDDGLDALETGAVAANQTIAAAAARYEQARALTALALAGRLPEVTVDPAIERQRLAGNRPGAAVVGTAVTESSFLLPVTASYEVDLFGKRRRTIEGAVASEQAGAADLENVRLVIEADLAADYFSLQQLAAEADVLDRTVQSLERGRQLMQARHDGGVASGLDLAQEDALLEGTRTQATLVRLDRDALEHAIAVLAGQPAPGFHVSARPLAAEPPAIELGMPSDLLERRPDIAEAERQMAAANADIGVAMTAYFPSLNLFGSGGWQSTALGSIFGAASTLWAIGASATETIFNGGATKARVHFAEAGYTLAVASYRDAVLNALREVEDGVTGLSVLRDARTSQTAAVAAAQRALDIATDRYQGGLANYLDVVSAQQALLASQRLAVQLQGEQLVTAVSLIKALGGGWDAKSLSDIKTHTRH